MDVIAVATIVTPEGHVPPGDRVSLPADEAASLIAAGLATLAPDEPAPDVAPDLEAMTRDQLLAHAAELGVEVDGKAAKARILDAIKMARGAAPAP
jgi:hypothetical protein